ncbi:hypothetical protein [Roseibium sp. TrichSKD4]|uniref:hypothetical protein n=1 Tax=Roseibium sp. TrichSKD4 TaxID=744980 RepID=UPI0011125711|nr:hypothetical protein [Roseibium sp. TrichSKD4]
MLTEKPASIPPSVGEEIELQELPSVPETEPEAPQTNTPRAQLNSLLERVSSVSDETRATVKQNFSGLSDAQKEAFLDKLESEIEGGDAELFLRLAALQEEPEGLANLGSSDDPPPNGGPYQPFGKRLRKELSRIERRLSPEDFEQIKTELLKSSPEDREIFLIGIQNTKNAQKPSFARLWVETEEDNRPLLVDAWTNKDPLAMKTYLRRTYGNSGLPDHIQTEVKEFVQSIADSNLSTSEATQRVKDYLTKKFPNFFPADGTLIKLVRIAKGNGSIAFWTLFGLGLSAWIFYELGKSQSASSGSQTPETDNTKEKEESKPGTELGPGPNGEDPSTETARHFGTANTLADENGVLMDDQGNVIGTYDKNGNLIKAGTKDEIIKPDGTPIGKYSTPKPYAFVNPDIGREDRTQSFSVILNENGDIVDPNGTVIARKAEKDATGAQLYTLVSDGSKVYIWWSDLFEKGTNALKAENVERSPFWRTFNENGKETIYYYPVKGQPVRVENVGETQPRRTDLGPGPGGEDPATETARHFGSARTQTDGNGVLRDQQGKIIGTYDKNGNLIKEGTKDEIIKPDGTPIGKYSQPKGYSFVDPDTGLENPDKFYRVILNENGDIVDTNGDVVAHKAETDPTGLQLYTLVSDGSKVYIWWSDLFEKGTDALKAENVEQAPFWRTFEVDGEEKTYFYPSKGEPVPVENVGDTS